MRVIRREFAAGLAGFTVMGAYAHGVSRRGTRMYGLIGKMNATAGQRDAQIAILLESTDEMPGCLGYVVATDATDPDGIWITEVWDTAESHRASLSLPAVQQAIARARPLIAGFGPRYETTPVSATMAFPAPGVETAPLC